LHLIGLDIGTTSICGVLMNTANGEIVKSITKDNGSSLKTPHSWEFIQEPESILGTIRDIVAELCKLNVSVSAIGVTGQMHGILYVDEGGNPVSPLFTWQDQRGDLPYTEGLTYAEHIRRLTNYPVSTGYGMVTHFYNVVNALVPAESAALCTIADFVSMKLANRTRPVIDSTNAASIGLFDMKELEFDTHALKSVGINPAVVPEVVPSGTVIGYTDDGKPVISALGDNQASFLGAVRDIRSSILLNIGTGSQISVYTDRFQQAEGLETRPFPGGGYILVGASLSGGKSYALLESFFREVCFLFTGYNGGSLYEMMNRLAGNSDGTSLKVNTQFYGTRQDPHKLGSIERITPSNFTPRHLVTGFLEGIIGELYQYYEAFPEQIKKQVSTLVASGNGVRSNPAMRRMLQQTFGFQIDIPIDREEASYGAALCAGVGCGLYKDFFSAAGSLIPNRKKN
jgi:sedoheptulokinase